MSFDILVSRLVFRLVTLRNARCVRYGTLVLCLQFMSGFE